VVFSPTDPANDLHGFRERPANRQIEWFRFFEVKGGPKNKLQPARSIDTQIAAGLGKLPREVVTGQRSLAVRNLRRGKALGLPTGQDVARAMGLPRELILSTQNTETPFSIGTGYGQTGAKDESVPEISDEKKIKLTETFGDTTPLWYYIL